MSISKKLKWRRSINELKFLYEELELVNETCKAAGRDFETYYREYCSRPEVGIDIGELERQHNDRLVQIFGAKEEAEEQPEEAIDPMPGALMAVDIPEKDKINPDPATEEDKQIHEIFNKLFKKIAIALHPDKVSSLDISPFLAQEMIEAFKTAKKAYEERRYFVLIEIAEKYDIYPPDNYARQSKWFRKESERVGAQILEKKNTYNYIFSECPDWGKDELIRRFLNRLFGI